MISEYQGPTPTDRFVQSVLLDYSEGDHEFEKELITSYMTSVEEHLPQLSSAFETKDTKGAILHSHDIKGSSSYIGAEAVRYLSGKIEAYCKSDQLEEAESFYPELQTEVTEVFKVLNDYMNSWDDEGGNGQQEDEEKATTEKDSTTTEDSNKQSPPNNSLNNSNHSSSNSSSSNNSKAQSNHDSSSSSSPIDINKQDQIDNKLRSDKIATETVNNTSSSTKHNSNIETDKINEKINNNSNNNTTSTKIDS